MKPLFLAITLSTTFVMFGCGGEPPEPTAQERLAQKQLELIEAAEQEKRNEDLAKKTHELMYSIRTACQAYEVDFDVLPTAKSVEEVAPLVEPTYIRTMPRMDGWSRAFAFASGPGDVMVSSLGIDGVPSDDDLNLSIDFGFKQGKSFLTFPEVIEEP